MGRHRQREAGQGRRASAAGASSKTITPMARKAGSPRRAPRPTTAHNAQKAKAKAAQKTPNPNGKGKKAARAAKAKAKAGSADAAGLADNGVLFTLADVTEDSACHIKTAQGEFSFKLSEIPYGKFIERLDGGVEIERTAAARQVTSDRKTDHDYPAAAAAKDGTAYIDLSELHAGHRPR